eukprot:maker-scaffold838_size90379-snap-gene-0.10 protein:Tk02521 transcript:maker-scaffold838_size90379-snap-gene-0.10-mRNA-1 annotation:"zinc transporter zip14"
MQGWTWAWCLWAWLSVLSHAVELNQSSQWQQIQAYAHQRASNQTSSIDCESAESRELCQAVEACFNASSEATPDFLCQALVEASLISASRRFTKRHPPPSSSVWGYGILCVTIISMTSVVGAALLPCMSKSFYKALLTGLIGLAVGSLSGSAVFHLIPSAFSLSEVSFFPHHSYLNISLVIFGGIYLFFIIERFLKMVMEFKSRRAGYTFHQHSHGLAEMHSQDAGDALVQDIKQLPNGESTEPILKKASRVIVLDVPEIHEEEEADQQVNAAGHRISCAGQNSTNRELYEDSQQAIRASFGHMDRPEPNHRPTVGDVQSLTQKTHIATVAWMIIFGDGVHNFIDGLSIGAAFSESILTGISVSLAVLCEEFPHELGDFAVLLNSGMSMKQALSYNFLSACTCYLGLVIGICLGELHIGNEYIFGLAGGMFLYIALVDMVPEMNATTDKQAEISLTRAGWTFFIQNVGMLTGIMSLFFLAKYQDDIAFNG